MTKISVIIPTLNEEEYIGRTIESIREKAFGLIQEIIVVDSGSTDGTIRILKQFTGVRYYEKPELIGRKYAILNFGASLSNGEFLFFLDADSQLPTHYDQKIFDCLSNKNVVAGAFDLQLHHGSIFLNAISFFNKIRYRISKNFYGDQGLFIKKNDFIRSGGYPPRPLMESAYFCRKLKKMGKLRVISQPILTSSRRFTEGGILKVFLKDVMLLFLFNLRLPITRFAKKYWQFNERTD